MSRRVASAALLAVFAAHSLHADVTLHRATKVTVGAFLPPQMQAEISQRIAGNLPPDTVIRIKGNQSYSTMGSLVGITDYATNRITLLNPKTKQFATGGLTEYLDGMAAATQDLTQTLPPEAQQLLQRMKFDVQVKNTGRRETIQGILAEESVITLAMGMQVGQTLSPTTRIEMHCWTVQPSELTRNAAIKELAVYTTRNKEAMDPTQALQKLFSQMPNLGDQLKKPIAQLTQASGGLMLRVRAAIFVPALVQAMPQLDPTLPMEELQTEVTELSTAPVDDSVFAVPADYQSAPLQDLLKVMLPPVTQPKPAAFLPR